MSLLRVAGQCSLHSWSTLGRRCARVEILSARQLVSPRWIQKRGFASTLRNQSTEKTEGNSKPPAHRYPENLNIFNSGSPPTVTAGLIRIATTIVLGYGVLWLTPQFVLDPTLPSYLAPVIAVGAAMPLLATGLLFGGYVHHVNVILPAFARRSKQSVMHFASNIPPGTVIEIKSMWFRPWPVTKKIYFEDLRRLPRSWMRLSNLENSPPSNRSKADKNPMWNWLALTLMGRYFVSRTQQKDRSRAPGVWDKMWEQIPMSGQEPIKKDSAGKGPVVAANRRSVASRKLPPSKPKR